MSSLEVVRAWKDPEFRATLGYAVPDHPAGEIVLADPGLDGIANLDHRRGAGNLSHSTKDFLCTLFVHCHKGFAAR